MLMLLTKEEPKSKTARGTAAEPKEGKNEGRSDWGSKSNTPTRRSDLQVRKENSESEIEVEVGCFEKGGCHSSTTLNYKVLHHVMERHLLTTW